MIIFLITIYMIYYPFTFNSRVLRTIFSIKGEAPEGESSRNFFYNLRAPGIYEMGGAPGLYYYNCFLNC